MLLILEIWLTVRAFKNGWRWRVLWPLGAALAVGVLLAGAGPVDEVKPVYLLIDVGLVAALAVMARRVPADGTATAAAPERQPSLDPARGPALDEHAA